MLLANPEVRVESMSNAQALCCMMDGTTVFQTASIWFHCMSEAYYIRGRA